jgi:hypothetical protein
MEPVGSSIWFKQIRDFKNNTCIIIGFTWSRRFKTTLKTAFKQKYTFSALANDILEVLDFLEIKKSHLLGFH